MLELPYHGPTVRGHLVGQGGGIAYEIRLLDGPVMESIADACDTYLSSRIGPRTANTANLYDDELVLRICAQSVRNVDTGAQLAPLPVWRRLSGSQVRQCARQYAELLAAERPNARRLDIIFNTIHSRVDAIRSSGARVLEDCRVLFARDLRAYYGIPAVRLSLTEIAYYVYYRVTLNDESRRT